jgi:hypothetical protein
MAKIELIQWLLKHPRWWRINGKIESLHTFGTVRFGTIKIRLGEIS